MGIPRFPITRDSMDVFSGKIRGRLDAIGMWQSRAPLWARRVCAPSTGEAATQA